MASTTFGNPGAPSQVIKNLDAVFATSLSNYNKKLQDNISTSIPLLKKMQSSKAWKSYSGGTDLRVPLMTKLTRGDSYKGYDVLPTDPTDGITQAVYPWARWAVPISISEDEETDNMGEGRLIELFSSKIMQSELGIKEDFNQQILQGNGMNGGSVVDPYLSPNNASNGILPLAHLVQVDPTSSLAVGNIDQDSRTWWRNQSTTFTGITTTTALLQKVITLINNCSKGPGGIPDLIVTDQTTYEWLEIAVYHRSRHEISETADFPFANFKFRGVTFCWDEHVSDPVTDVTNCDTYGVIYALNTQFFEMKYHPSVNFKNDPFVTPYNQAAKSSHIRWKGQLVVTNRRKHGVGHTIPRTFTIS
jgi:hypothetical protein